ncbi:MAG: hypothetical protein KGJ60_15900, partial [Verrucomicrobiota bacterium]|nr:hypothetical protein [Verrucomicrobiota bacterium]
MLKSGKKDFDRANQPLNKATESLRKAREIAFCLGLTDDFGPVDFHETVRACFQNQFLIQTGLRKVISGS